MIGIVLVSHSKKLIEGLLELLEQMNHDHVPIEGVGGTDNKENPIGTDAIKIFNALKKILNTNDSLKGIVVLMDIGSALMATEAALDFLNENEKQKIWLSHGPIVEGAIVALGSALSNTSMKEICKDIASSLSIKENILKEYFNNKE